MAARQADRLGGYEILEHPADVGIAFFGRTREEALVQAARGLTFLLVDDSSIAEAREQVVAASGRDDLELLFNWLGEVLVAFDADRMLCSRFVIESEGERHVSARLIGEEFDPARHQVAHDVKAVTYHQMAFSEDPKGVWHGRVYFDI